MRFKIICVGKIKETYYVNIIENYRKQIEKFHEIKIIQYDDEKIPQNASEVIKQRIVEKESRLCMTGIEKGDYVIALCIDGKKCTTKEFSKKNRRNQGAGISDGNVPDWRFAWDVRSVDTKSGF